MSKTPVRTLTRQGATVHIYPDKMTASQAAAQFWADAMTRIGEQRADAKVVLGMATGSTPIPFYAELVDLHRRGHLSFAKAVIYNLDEYYPISPLDPNSYHYYMHQHLFGQIDVPANQTHLLDGSVPHWAIGEHCRQFDRWIVREGGIDLQLLGIGRNGHIGFNEPTDLPGPAASQLPTRRITLHPVTRADAGPSFGGRDHVPRHALALGTEPILAARQIVMLAFGTTKAEAVARSLDGPITGRVPGSLLQQVGPNVTWWLNSDAAALLRD